jgi:hypothetical protein
MYLRHFPRVVLLDLTGEWSAPDPSRGYPGPLVIAEDVADLTAQLKRLASRGRWIVSLELDPGEFPELVDWLIPIPSPRQRSPVPKLGGLALLVDEVDILSSQGTASGHIRTLYRRSRHVGLSIISATQRPENVGREVSAQSGQAVALSLPEPRGRDYMQRLMRWTPEQLRAWDRWTRKHRHGGMWRDLQSGEVRWIPDHGPMQKDRPSAVQTSLLSRGEPGDGRPASGADGDGEGEGEPS